MELKPNEKIDIEKILEDLEQKQKEFEKIIPKLQGLKQTPKGARVEILKGIKGLRTIFLEIIKGNENDNHPAILLR